MSDAAQFYGNRVLKEFKEKDPIHFEWVKQWMKVLSELQSYVKQYHTTGLTWGSLGQQDSSNVGESTVPKAVPPPPPPPPPPPSLAAAAASLSASLADDGRSRDELLNSINALGEGAASHLKKVPDELKLQKNPQLREQTAHQTVERSNQISVIVFF